MSAAAEKLTNEISKRKTVPLLKRCLEFLSSVRLGVSLLIILLVLSMIGMLIIQQNVQGFDGDLRMIPGRSSATIEIIRFNLDKKERYNVTNPFSINCPDIQQTLIDPKGGLGVENTLDWRDRMVVNDPEYGETTADVSMNRPFTYRAYRFFQAQTLPVGSAREIKLELTPQTVG